MTQQKSMVTFTQIIVTVTRFFVKVAIICSWKLPNHIVVPFLTRIWYQYLFFLFFRCDGTLFEKNPFVSKSGKMGLKVKVNSATFDVKNTYKLDSMRPFQILRTRNTEFKKNTDTVLKQFLPVKVWKKKEFSGHTFFNFHTEL